MFTFGRSSFVSWSLYLRIPYFVSSLPTFIETIATYSDSQELREKKETHWLFLSNDISGSASSSLLGTDVRNPYWTGNSKSLLFGLFNPIS